jgi:oxygen-independent coproporphyrinogen-3 oxidase
MSLGIYIHIPFCVRKCPYCDFTSFPTEAVFESEYVDALKKEMESRALEAGLRKEIRTIYIGGGTPSIFPPIIIYKLLSHLLREFKVRGDAEITIEANPGTVNLENLKGYRDVGINRLSLGVQSLNDRLLSTLGRIHNRQQAIDAYEDAREAGFDNIGIDLIHSIPGESLSDWKRELNEVVLLGPEHISAYSLTIEEGTRFHSQMQKGVLPIPSEETQLDMFLTTEEILEKAGYEHYEVSNYAIPGFRSRHNQIYWNGGEYIGLGLSAHSYISDQRIRTANSSNLEEYFRLIKEKGNAVIEEEMLTKEKAMGEAVFLGLRMLEGIDLEVFKERFGVGIETAFSDAVSELTQKGLLEMTQAHLRLTKQGLLLLNDVSVRFV